MTAQTSKYTLDQIDDCWIAVHEATLLFILDGDNILLIRKKRGLGAGKINGPGGKVELGETVAECAVREVEEELGVTPQDPVGVGELRFQFTDDYSLHVYVYLATRYSGQPIETDEAVPLWFDIADIPYSQMWEDDQIWLPRVLAGEQVFGRFVFDDDKMLEHEVRFKAR